MLPLQLAAAATQVTGKKHTITAVKRLGKKFKAFSTVEGKHLTSARSNDATLGEVRDQLVVWRAPMSRTPGPGVWVGDEMLVSDKDGASRRRPPHAHTHARTLTHTHTHTHPHTHAYTHIRAFLCYMLKKWAAVGELEVVKPTDARANIVTDNRADTIRGSYLPVLAAGSSGEQSPACVVCELIVVKGRAGRKKKMMKMKKKDAEVIR